MAGIFSAAWYASAGITFVQSAHMKQEPSSYFSAPIKFVR